MSIRKKIKKNLSNSLLGVYSLHFLRKTREIWALRLNDYKYLRKVYKKRFGRGLNLRDPQTFFEKLNWLKLFYHTKEIERCSDKYLARGYLEEKGYKKYLNKLIGVYDRAKDIDFKALPQKFVIKVSHGSSWNVICTDKSKLNVKKTIAKLNCWQKEDISVFGREWNYRSSPRKIIIEEFIEAPSLVDYKFFCLNGKVTFMQVNHDEGLMHYIDYYDANFNRLHMKLYGYNSCSNDLEKPPKFDEMKKIAEELAKNFPSIRVDFYNPDERIFLGELTFFVGGGLMPFEPKDTPYDKQFGDALVLPEPNYNLDLYNKLKK